MPYALEAPRTVYSPVAPGRTCQQYHEHADTASVLAGCGSRLRAVCTGGAGHLGPRRHAYQPRACRTYHVPWHHRPCQHARDRPRLARKARPRLVRTGGATHCTRASLGRALRASLGSVRVSMPVTALGSRSPWYAKTGPEPQTGRQGPRQVCHAHGCALPWTRVSMPVTAKERVSMLVTQGHRTVYSAWRGLTLTLGTCQHASRPPRSSRRRGSRQSA